MGQPWSLFHLFLFFSHKQYKFYNKLLLLLMFQRYEKTFISFANMIFFKQTIQFLTASYWEKMFIQYPVLGFEPTIS